MPQTQTQWLIYAIASGACAALNGVFAKLTTTKLTTLWAAEIGRFFGMGDSSALLEYVVRGSFFLMNLAFNGVMWGLFTRALTLSSSTVRVSVMNTSANFMVTALLGVVVFSEDLPGLWWIGASLLVAGSVIIGRRDEDKDTGASGKTRKNPEKASRGKDSRDPVRATGRQTTGNSGPNSSSERKRL